MLPYLALCCLLAAVLLAPGAAQPPPRLVAEHQVQAGPGGVKQHLHLLQQHSTVQHSTAQYSTVQHLRPAVLNQRQVGLQLYLLVILPNLSTKVEDKTSIPYSCFLTWGAKFLLWSKYSKPKVSCRMNWMYWSWETFPWA